MAFINNRYEAKAVMDDAIAEGVSLAIFCTASHWNTEAILIAAQRYARTNALKRIPVVVAMTSHYDYMQQSMRVTRCGDACTGIRAVMEYCRLLCDGPDAPYREVDVLPHLDHADPVKDKEELTQALACFCSVMFDAQKYTYEENVRLTKAYIEAYGDQVLVEGAVEQLNVGEYKKAHQIDDYVRKAVDYVHSTGVDFLVADLGTEQQSSDTKAHYLKHRAQALTQGLGRPMLVLHGTSSLSDHDIGGFSEDGVVRVNMWTRIVREAGQYAARQVVGRFSAIEKGDFEACEGRQYLNDSIDKAADIMYTVLNSLSYAKLGSVVR